MDGLGRALDALDAGDWDGAHDIAAAAKGPLAAWLHAHIHRVEGDPANARYWYARAGRAPHEGSLESERAELRAAAGA